MTRLRTAAPKLAVLAAALLLAGRAAWRLATPLFRQATAEQNLSRSIIQHASDAIITTDDNQRIVLANPSAAAMFGTTVDAMEGALLKQFIPREQRLPAESDLQYFGATGIGLPARGRRASDYVVTGLRASGQHFPLEGSVSSVAEDGRQLYTIILRDVTERKLVEQKLEQSHTQLRELSAALQTIREEERTHIARELHDDLGQLLAALRVNMALLRKQSNRGEAAKLLADMDALLLSAITSLRRIASNLRPRALDEGGLYFALESLRQEFARRHGIACLLIANEAELVLNDTYSTAIFRIAQEALTNIARHAQASNVSLELRRSEEALHLRIHDDGRGIAEQDINKASSFGLVGMRERVWALHGDITIVSDGGTLIAISLPLPPSESLRTGDAGRC